MAVQAPRQPVAPPQAYAPAGPAIPPSQQHGPGRLPPGTKVQVGKYIVRVERFLSEGGFSHVYLSTLVSPSSIDGFSPSQNRFVLKRMAVPDKAGLSEVRKEVDVMKQLRPHKHIVHFIEASASSLPGGGGYEIFILMEYCPGGGIIDLLNSRLQNRLTESEILKIFSDTCEAVAHMHSQRPIMMHRDLKVENILVAAPNLYKLCDFGSTCTPLPRPPQTTQEIQALEADLNKHTTLQYRAPEMVDVWSRKGVDEKADIWALGVFLYKLCYYTTPFEDHGPLAIMNVQYKIPPYPAYSGQIKALIGTLLQESARARPDVWKVYEDTCRLRGVTPRMPRPASRQPSTANAPAASSSAPPGRAPTSRAPATNGLDSIITTSASSPILSAVSEAENVVPMRRGRPTKAKEGSSVERSSRMATTGGVTVKGPLSAKDSPKSSVSGAPWVIPKSATGEPSPTSKARETPDEQDLFARESAAGFGHSFASPPPDASLQKNASAFGDSFNPPAAGKPVPTSFAARQKGLLGTTHGLRPTPVPSRGPSPPAQPAPITATSWSSSVSAPAAVQGPSPSQRIAGSVASAAKAVDGQSSRVLDVARTDTLPLSRSSHLGSSFTTSSGATDLGQSQVGPIDWRGKPARIELISRSSQTSPSLSEGLPPLATVKARTAAYAAQASSSLSAKPPSKSQRDLLDASDDETANKPVVKSQWSGALDQRSQATAKKRLSMPIDTPATSLAAGRSSFKANRPFAVEDAPEPSLPPRPRPRADTASTLSSISTSSSSSSEGPESADESPTKKFGHHEIPEVAKTAQPRASEASLLDTPNEMADTPRASLGKPAVGPKPVATSPPTLVVPQEASWPDQAGAMRRTVSDASEEEDPDTVTRRRAAIAKFAPSADSHPPSPPPAEAVEHRDPFATRAGDRAESLEAKRPGDSRAQRQTDGPPLRAPKPQSLRNNAAITNLVSRYENLSASESGLTSPELDKQQPPAVPAKNVAGAGAGGPSSKRFSATVDNFGRRFPPAESDNTGDRPRFRPTPSGRTASPPKAGPMIAAKRVHIPRQSLGPGQLPLPSAALKRDEPSPLPSGGVQWEGKEGGADDEERFAGVDNLKSRWESGAVKRAEQPIRASREDYGVKP